MSRPLDFSNYDQYMCPKPPMLLWLAVIYLSRAITLPVLSEISSIAGGSADTNTLIRSLFSPYSLFPSLIAAVVMYAFLRRSPKASRVVRWIWARGRLILAVSAVVDLGLWFTDLPTGQGMADLARVLAAALDVYFFVYVLAARRVREVFAQFPAAA